MRFERAWLGTPVARASRSSATSSGGAWPARGVKKTRWPLLGGTIVGLLAFSPIGFSPDNTGEYAGSLFWGFNADWDALPDLHEFVQAIEHEFETLRKL